MKKLFMFICTLTIMALLAACGGGTDDAGDDNGADNGNGAAVTAETTPPPDPTVTGIDGIDWSENVTFSWFFMATPGNDYYSDFAYNPVSRYLENRFNITFDFHQAPVGTDADHLALMMGAGTYTDVIALASFTGSIPQLFYDGVIVDIAEWLDYMPNMSYLLETNAEFNRRARDDQGRILLLPPTLNEEVTYPWSGLMYRHDILVTMTDDNVQFPSGNDVPTTLEDWEYMLPIFHEYFTQAGFADFAPLIIPGQSQSVGLFVFGELMNSFGGFHDFYVRNGVVHAGMLEPAMFEYTQTMRDWFERGWIHQDFLSQTTGMFFMPNPPLVFGGAAGVWFGMTMHMGDRMSVPEHDMHFDVRPIPSPVGPGVTHQDMIRRGEDNFGALIGSAVYAGNPDIGRFLAVMDFLYTYEGGVMRQLGLRGDQIPPNDTMMARMGMPDGSHTFDANGLVIWHENLDTAGGHINRAAVNGIRFPGFNANSHENAVRPPEMINAHAMWGAQDEVTQVHPLPFQLTPTVAEAAILAANEPRIIDLRDQHMAMFITGGLPLNEDTWAEFTNQLIDAGMLESQAIWQAAYDRFTVRGQ